MSIRRSAAAIIVAILVSGPWAQALIVDSFDTAQGPLSGAGTFNAVTGSGILGGERDVELVFFPATSGFNVSGGVLTLSQTSSFTDIYVTYDGADNSSALAMGLGSLNLLANGNAFQVDLLATSGSTPHAHLYLRAYTTASLYNEIHLILDADDFPSTLLIPFTSMTDHTGANFSNINAIQMELAIGSGIAMDLNLGALTVVPEPSTLVLVIGSLGLAAGRHFMRRRPLVSIPN